MNIVFIILLFVLLISLILFYYYKLLKRIFLIFKDKVNNKLIIFLSIILCLLTVNMFSIVGLFLIHFFFISLLVDILFLIFRKVIKNNRIINIYKLSIIPLLITLIIMGYGFFNIRNIVETKYTIYTDKEINSDIRVLLITDSHYGKIFNKKSLDSLKSRLDSVDADIVILGGDIVDESTTKSEMEYIFSVLGDIKNKYGIYFVYGNHDEQQYNMSTKYSYDDLNKAIVDNDINILKDSFMVVDENIVIAGRNDYSMGRSEIATYLNDVSKESYLIMVDHQPVNYAEDINFGVDLIVSGHTHGGQIFPIEFFINLLHTADLSYGYDNFDGMDAIVSSGVAGWGYPIRTSHNSEYVVIDIKNQ